MLIILNPLILPPPKSGVSPMFMGHQTGDMAPSPLYNFGSLVKKPTRHSRFGAWTQNAWNDEVNKKVTKRRSKFFEKWKKKIVAKLAMRKWNKQTYKKKKKNLWEEEEYFIKLSWNANVIFVCTAQLRAALLYSCLLDRSS